MKTIVIALIALTGSFATAGALDASQYNYDNQTSYRTSCVEGTKETFYVSNPVNGHMVAVERTCVDGRFFPKSTTVARPCTEGNRTFVTEQNPINDRSTTTVYVCVHGKYVRAY